MVTLIASDRATGDSLTIIMTRAEFHAWLRTLGKTRFYDAIFSTASRRLQ